VASGKSALIWRPRAITRCRSNGAAKSSLWQALASASFPQERARCGCWAGGSGAKVSLPSLVRDQVAYLPQSFGVAQPLPLSVG